MSNNRQSKTSGVGIFCARIFSDPRGLLGQRRRRKQLKPLLLVRRERTLTIPDESSITADSNSGALKPKKPTSSASSQTACLLFRLPFELRLAIYKAVIGAENVHILWRGGKLHSFRDVESGQNIDVHNREHGRPWTRPKYTDFPKNHSGLGVLPVLQTCRRVYSEMTPILYKTPTFTFHNWVSLLAFSGAILPHRFNAVTSITIDVSYATVHQSWVGDNALVPLGLRTDWKSSEYLQIWNQLPNLTPVEDPTMWTAVCTNIAEMGGLKMLKLDLARNCFGSIRVDDEVVLKPLMEVWKARDLLSFEVKIDWENRKNWQPSEEFPFVLTRIVRPFEMFGGLGSVCGNGLRDHRYERNSGCSTIIW